MVDFSTYKQCPRCKTTQPGENFGTLRRIRGKEKRVVISKRSWCRKCTAKYVYQKYYHPDDDISNVFYISRAKKILKEHHERMKDDPEHLTTEFMAKLIGISCERSGR